MQGGISKQWRTPVFLKKGYHSEEGVTFNQQVHSRKPNAIFITLNENGGYDILMYHKINGLYNNKDAH